MAKKAKAKVKATTVVSTEIVSTAVVGARELPPGLVLKRRITLPSLSMKKKGDLRYLVIADVMRVSKVVDKPTADGKVKDPATVCTVGDVLSGEVFTWLVPAVCKSNLQNEYQEDTYVGKCFAVENMGRRSEGQRYNDFSLSEVDASAVTQNRNSTE
jgi:hypothetical protein